MKWNEKQNKTDLLKKKSRHSDATESTSSSMTKMKHTNKAKSITIIECKKIKKQMTIILICSCSHEKKRKYLEPMQPKIEKFRREKHIEYAVNEYEN